MTCDSWKGGSCIESDRELRFKERRNPNDWWAHYAVGGGKPLGVRDFESIVHSGIAWLFVSVQTVNRLQIRKWTFENPSSTRVQIQSQHYLHLKSKLGRSSFSTRKWYWMWIYKMFHGGVASASLCIRAVNWIDNSVANTLRWLITQRLVPILVICWVKCISFIKSHAWRQALKSDRMDQRSICLFLALKGLSARAVCNELTAVLDAGAIAYSTLIKYLRQRQFIPILVDLTPRNQRRLLLIKQFLIPLSIAHSLLCKSWLASPAFQILQSISTSCNHLALSWSVFAGFPGTSHLLKKRSMPLS
jgi:hypothetical protein